MTSNIRPLRRPATGSGRRQKVDWPVNCGSGRQTAPCRVVDISADGARISGAVPSNDNGIVLFFEHASPVRATIAWRSQDRMGVRFREQQAWIHDDCAKRFDAAAWLR